MVPASSFAIHLTYTCPLACAHCCFSSSPLNRDRLDPALVLETINNLDTNAIQMIAFTGGEPFLLGRHLVSFVRRAHERGLITRIVTSAYFGTTPKAAQARIDEVVEAGLDELSISWDDFHEEFVKFDTVRNVVVAAKRHPSVCLAINVVQGAETRWNAQRVRDELGMHADIVCESSLNLTGRADEELQNVGLRERNILGPCPYVLTGPTLSAKGKLLACCGVIPDTGRLTIDEQFDPLTMNAKIEEARRSILFTWIYLRGPYGIMEWMQDRYGIAIPAKDTVGGNCQACKILFETPEIDALLDGALMEKAPEVVGEYRLLESLGLAHPYSVMGMWLGHAPVPIKPQRA